MRCDAMRALNQPINKGLTYFAIVEEEIENLGRCFEIRMSQRPAALQNFAQMGPASVPAGTVVHFK